MQSPHSQQKKRRLIALVLSGCTCLLCLLMGLKAYYETEASSSDGSIPSTITAANPTPVVTEFTLTSENLIAQETQIETPIPEIPAPDLPIPHTPPVDPTPKPAPESIAQEVPQQPKTRTHVVAKGDTLSSIALEHYGSANRWQEIYKANKAVIPNKNNIKIGTVLTIP